MTTTPRGPRLGRRTLLAGALATAGCATVPTSGPVVQVEPASPSQVAKGVEVRPVPPTPDAPPDVVVAGFLDAMASLQAGHEVARQYLTAPAAQAWVPSAGVSVFDGDSRTTVTTGEQVTLQAALVGTLDAQGHFQPSAAGRTLRHTFDMQRVDGQWRIATPPAGLLVSQYTMEHRFRPLVLWFQSHTGAMVPERVWLARTDLGVTQAVQALLLGPSPWLGPAVTSGLPAGARLTAATVAVDRGVATVELDQPVELPDDQRALVLRQLALVLAPFTDVAGLRLSTAGQVWTGLGQDASGAAALAPLRDSLRPAAREGQVAAVVGGVVGALRPDDTFARLDGPLGTGRWPGGARQVARNDGVVAVVDDRADRLTVAREDEREPRLLLEGTGIGRPQVTATGQVWAFTDGDAARALWHGPADGRLAVASLPLLAGARIRALAVAPDEAMVALVLSRGGVDEFGLVRVNGPVVDGYRALPLVVSQSALSRVVDVGWTRPGELAVLAATASQGTVGTWTVSADGAQVGAAGPAGDQELVSLATVPGDGEPAACVLLASGGVLRREAAWRWRPSLDGVSAIGPFG